MSDTAIRSLPQALRWRAGQRQARYLILRAHPGRAQTNFYNSQELGLGGFLSRSGVDVAVAAAFRELPYESEVECRVHPLQFRPRHPAAALIRNLGELDLGSYDFVQISDLCLPGNLQVLRHTPPSTHVIVYQGHYPEPIGMGRWLRLAQSRMAARVLRRRPHTALAKNVEARRLLERSGIAPVAEVGVGLNAGPLLLPGTPPAEVGRFLERAPFTFLYVGSLDSRRPLPWILTHLRRPEFAEANLLIVGSGPARQKLWRRYSDLVQARRVMFVDRLTQAQLGHVYRRVGALVLPTRYEIYGMVCLEAVLFGVPVIASAVAGPVTAARRFPDSITLVPPGANPAAWRAALLAAMKTGPSIWRYEPDESMVRALSWETPGRAFLDTIQHVMSDGARFQPGHPA